MPQHSLRDWRRLTSGLYVPPLLHFGRGYGSRRTCCPSAPIIHDGPCHANNCSDGGPDDFQVTFADIESGDCDDCEDWNTTPFIVAFYEDASGPSFCTFELNMDVCNHTTLRVIVNSLVDKLYVNIDYDKIVWALDISCPVTCKTYDNQAVPFLLQHHTVTTCDYTPSTAYVTAI